MHINLVMVAKKDPDMCMWTRIRASDGLPISQPIGVAQHMPHNKYGTHHPEEIFQKVGKTEVFSKLNLRQASLQIPLAKGDEGKTCYWASNCLMAYCRMHALDTYVSNVNKPTAPLYPGRSSIL